METLFVFLGALITALALENAVLARALGLGRKSLFLQSPAQCLGFGAMLTYMAVASSFFVALVNFLLAENAYILIIRPLGYLLGIVIVYLISGKIFRHTFSAPLCEKIIAAMPVATLNSALFGAFYISASQSFGFFQTIGYTLGSGLGYTGALLIIYYARKRLAISPVSPSFRGIPILLIYLGLLSLALYGLVGHTPPT